MKSKATRQAEASDRIKAHNELNPKQKILKLDMRFGNGLGAKRERSRLALEVIQTPNAEVKTVPVTVKKKNYQKPKKS